MKDPFRRMRFAASLFLGCCYLCILQTTVTHAASMQPRSVTKIDVLPWIRRWKIWNRLPKQQRPSLTHVKTESEILTACETENDTFTQNNETDTSIRLNENDTAIRLDENDMPVRQDEKDTALHQDEKDTAIRRSVQIRNQHSQQVIANSRALLSAVASFLTRINARRIASVSVKALWVGVGVYAVVTVCTAVATVVSQLGEDPLFCTDAKPVMQWFASCTGANSTAPQPPSSATPPVLELVKTLVESGMTLASVESVLTGLTKSEATILQQCLWSPASSLPNDKTSTTSLASTIEQMWTNIAGLSLVKERLLYAAQTMFLDGHHKQRQQASYGALFDSSAAAAGMLLYGPPGCGKSLLLKALAATCRVPCLVVSPSLLIKKYVGESNERVRSLFSCAKRIAPCVVCLDEIDGLFRERSDDEHAVYRDMKNEFLQRWDGMTTETDARQILVVGASNRPFDIDSAVLRRLPQSFFIGLPDAESRSTLIRKLLAKVPTDERLDVDIVASMTNGYSPSDLKQLLQTAAMIGPLRDTHSAHVRPLTLKDIQMALQQTPPTALSPRYSKSLDNFARRTEQHSPDIDHKYYQKSQTKWETESGNFYNAGTIEMDRDTLSSFESFFDLIDTSFNETDFDTDAEDNDGI
jgi:hypothetical protein